MLHRNPSETTAPYNNNNTFEARLRQIVGREICTLNDDECATLLQHIVEFALRDVPGEVMDIATLERAVNKALAHAVKTSPNCTGLVTHFVVSVERRQVTSSQHDISVVAFMDRVSNPQFPVTIQVPGKFSRTVYSVR